jgi:hypothetical protein
MKPFADRPFAAGSLMGSRAWIIRDSGVLTGVYHRMPWQPYLNVAECDANPGIGAGVHELVGIDCECGFYAYHDGSNDYWQDRHGWTEYRIAGIIESWGRCVVGSRGFRCENAEIRALITPEGVDDVVLAGIRNCYPGAQWFATTAEAEAAFPLTVVV